MKPGFIKGSSRSLSQESSWECGFRSAECGVEQSVAGLEGGGLTTDFTDSTDESEDLRVLPGIDGAPGTIENEDDDEAEDDWKAGAGSLQMVPEPCR